MTGGGTRHHRGAATLTICVLALTLGVLSVVGLAACTDNPSPSPSATTSSAVPVTSSAAPSPTATPPTAPKAEPTPKSAEAFVKYFWDVYNYSYRNLDPKILESITESKCKFCTSTLSDIQQLKKSGAHLDGMTVHLSSAAAPPVKDAKRIAVVTVIHQDNGHNIRSDGSIQELNGRKMTQSLAALRWVGTSWKVYGISIDDQEKKP
jgi:hypothetical protein